MTHVATGVGIGVASRVATGVSWFRGARFKKAFCGAFKDTDTTLRLHEGIEHQCKDGELYWQKFVTQEQEHG